MRKIVLPLLFAASAIASVAGAAQTNPALATPRPPIRQDANRDGVATRAEAIAQADARFAQMDTDRDGRVTGGEMRAYRAALHDRMVASGRDVPVPPPGGGKHDGMGRRMDPNGDGSVTRDGWWLLRATTDYTKDGSSSQQMAIWNADGTPVAEQMQSVAIFA